MHIPTGCIQLPFPHSVVELLPPPPHSRPNPPPPQGKRSQGRSPYYTCQFGTLDRKIQTTRNNLNMNSQLWRKHEQGPEPMAWIRDQINNFSKSDNLSLKDVGTDHNFVIDQQRELLFSLRKVILMPSRITFLIEKSNSCVIENYWILYKCEKSNSRKNENCNQRELLSFFRSKIGRNKQFSSAMEKSN